MDFLRIILTALVQTRDGRKSRVSGICYHVPEYASLIRGERAADAASAWLRDAFQRLGLERVYPVDSGEPGVSNVQAFAACRDMWDPETQYGRNRLALLDKLIELAREECKRENSR